MLKLVQLTDREDSKYSTDEYNKAKKSAITKTEKYRKEKGRCRPCARMKLITWR